MAILKINRPMGYYDHPKRRGLPPIHVLDGDPLVPICGARGSDDNFIFADGDEVGETNLCDHCYAKLLREKGGA